MFRKLGRLVVGNPWKVIAAWLLATVAIVAFAPTLAEVTNADQAEFLPDTYESIQAQQLGERAFAKSSDATATIVVKRTDGQTLTAADQAIVAQVADAVKNADIERVTEAATGPQAVSPNKKVQLVSVGFEGLPDDPKIAEAVRDVRSAAKPELEGTDLRMAVTGARIRTAGLTCS